MGKRNEMHKRFKKSKKTTALLAGDPPLQWKKCAYRRGINHGWKAEISKEQLERIING